MKKIALTLLVFTGSVLFAQEANEKAVKAAKVKKETVGAGADSASTIPSVIVGLGVLPGHQLRRDGFTSTPLRIQVMGARLYKGFGLFGAVEFASADAPFADNSSDPNDPSTWANSYFRHMLGLQYSFGKFGAYAGMDMFSKNGFFRSVGEGGTIGSGRKTLGVTYNAFKGLTVSLDFSAYAGPAIGVNYQVPLKGLK